LCVVPNVFVFLFGGPGFAFIDLICFLTCFLVLVAPEARTHLVFLNVFLFWSPGGSKTCGLLYVASLEALKHWFSLVLFYLLKHGASKNMGVHCIWTQKLHASPDNDADTDKNSVHTVNLKSNPLMFFKQSALT
jgi:hypothetical protein